MTDTKPDQSPGREHRLLNVFVGTWETNGEIRATDDAPAAKIVGADVYEWFDGGFFLIHRVDVRMGDAQVKTLEVIGHDAASGGYSTRFFDNQGNTGAYRASFRDGVWTFQTESGRERATAEPSRDGSRMSVHWERSDDGVECMPWMDLTLTKAT